MKRKQKNTLENSIHTFLLCPECLGDQFHKDYVLLETSCKKCGLVLTAPVSQDFKPAGYIVHKIGTNFTNIKVIVETHTDRSGGG